MRRPRMDAPIADEPPVCDVLTPYDEFISSTTSGCSTPIAMGLRGRRLHSSSSASTPIASLAGRGMPTKPILRAPSG